MDKQNECICLGLAALVERQKAFSLETFGPGRRLDGCADHIFIKTEELREVLSDLDAAHKYASIVLLAIDGLWRLGGGSVRVAELIAAKLAENRASKWPDWRTMPQDKAIRRIKGAQDGRGEGPDVVAEMFGEGFARAVDAYDKGPAHFMATDGGRKCGEFPGTPKCVDCDTCGEGQPAAPRVDNGAGGRVDTGAGGRIQK